MEFVVSGDTTSAARALPDAQERLVVLNEAMGRNTVWDRVEPAVLSENEKIPGQLRRNMQEVPLLPQVSGLVIAWPACELKVNSPAQEGSFDAGRPAAAAAEAAPPQDTGISQKLTRSYGRAARDILATEVASRRA